MRKIGLVIILLAVITSACNMPLSKYGLGKFINTKDQLGICPSPALDNLTISTFSTSFIILASPISLFGDGSDVTMTAYIGIDGEISVEGKVVTDYIEQKTIDSTDVIFNSLTAYQMYRIIVVSENNCGYSVDQIVQHTGLIAPVLNDLIVSSWDTDSITLSMPTLSTPGNPQPTVRAYISYYIEGGEFNAIQGPIDVSRSGYTFNNLPAQTEYIIRVDAENSEGLSSKNIIINMAAAPPVLGNLSVSAIGLNSINLDKPTFISEGSPAPPNVHAYIGYDGTIESSGAGVTGYLQGPIDASEGCQFNGLAHSKKYRIIVIADNVNGFSAKDILVETDRILYVTCNNIVTFFNASTGEYLNGTQENSRFTTGSEPNDIAVNSAANILYVANSNSDTVTYFNATTGAYINGTLENSSFITGDNPSGIALNSAANILYVANSNSDTVTYFNATTGAYINGTLNDSSFITNNNPKVIAVNSGSNIMLLSNRNFQWGSGLDPDKATFYNASNGSYMNGELGNSSLDFASESQIYGLKVNSESNIFYVLQTTYVDGTGYSSYVVYLNALTGAYLYYPWENSYFITDYSSTPRPNKDVMALNSSENILYVANRSSDSVTLFNATTGAYTNGTLENSRFSIWLPEQIAINAYKNILYTHSYNHTVVYFYNATTGDYYFGTKMNSYISVPATVKAIALSE